jgi:anti-sigma B factor antagonist
MAPVYSPQPDVIALEGEIDMHESPEVKNKLYPLIQEHSPRLLIDMQRVSYIDSSGLAVLIDALQRMQSYGGKLALFGIRQSVRVIFEIARLDQVFSIYPDKAAAETATA